VIIEQRSADYVLGRIRAGVLEQVDRRPARAAGVADAPASRGPAARRHRALLRRRAHRIDFTSLTGGKRSTSTARPRSRAT
jgi:p-hydroxybenzoate 3-monooxygenase